jgi:serine/threonine protein phosphatase PrpC
MTQPDDLTPTPAAPEQVPPPEFQATEALPAESLPTQPQAFTPPETTLPVPTPTVPETLIDGPQEDGPLDVDYVFPSSPEVDSSAIDGAEGDMAEAEAPENNGAEGLESPEIEQDSPDSDALVDADRPVTLENPAPSESPVLLESATLLEGSDLPEHAALPDPAGDAALLPTDGVIGERVSDHQEPPIGLEAAATATLSDLSSFATGELEEETYAPTVAVHGPQAGAVISGYHLNQDLGRGWFSANAVGAGPSVDVYVRPEPLWAGLRPHRLLPRPTQVGDLWVLAPNQGTPLTVPLDPATAQAHLTELARLLFALEKQGYAVTDLDPASIQLTGEGLKLRTPPQVARLGEAVLPTLRDSFTPPEVQEGQPAQAKSGVYLLGALFFQWMTGRSLPAEGPSSIILAGIRASGVPQLLSGMLAPLPQRLTPTELLAALKTAATRLPVYQLAAATDIGLNPERPTNEDSYGFVWRQTGQHGGGELILRAVVSDGMGGMAAGEVASQAAVRAFLGSEATGPEGSALAGSALEARVWEANAAVLTDMQGRDGGCTLTGVEIHGTRLQLGHVGDTRAYVAQGGEVQQLSKDHSYVAAMVASGQMTPEEAQVSPERNKVLRSLGSLRAAQDNYVQVLPEPLELPVGSRVLLVSDGVWGEVPPPTLHDLLLHEPSLQGLVDRLIELSLESGAPDNVTALVIERVR